jgi:hypothetical protein
MTAKQLIDILSAIPADTPVFVDGYEDGACVPFSATLCKFVDKGPEREWYYGRYEKDENGPITALIISR